MQENNSHKQAFWFTIINYVGIVIGVVSTIFVYPNDKEFLGIVRYVDSIAQILFPIMVFGGAQALIHFYPDLSEANRKQLFKYGIRTILAISLLVLVFLFIGDFFITWNNFHYVFYAFPIAFSLAFVELFKRQATNLQKLSVPTFYEKIIPKLALPIVFILLLSGYFNVISSLVAFIISYFILLVLLSVYLFRQYKINMNFDFSSLFSQISKRDYYKYSFYSFVGSFGSFFAFRVDSFMIPEFLSFEANGTYSIGVMLASALAIPATGMYAIYAPQVSSLIKSGNIKVLAEKYIETSKLLFFIGAVLFGCIVLGIDSLFQMLPTYDKLVDSIPIIVILGANVLFNMATGFNSEIISYSKYYRFNIISVLVLVVINISLNVYFLTQTHLGIMGVAYASLIAMTLFNSFKLYFIYSKFGILPFDKKYGQLFLTISAITFSIYLLPGFSNHFLNLIFKVLLNCILIIAITYKLKLVFSLNFWLDKIFEKINIGKQKH